MIPFRFYNKKKNNPPDAAGLGRKFLEESDREQVMVCCQNTKNQPVSLNVVSIGCLNSSLNHPRETFKPAILSNAAGIILFHNHPSEDPEPSQEDINISTRIKEAGKIMSIELLDHIIIGSGGAFCSLKGKGLLFRKNN